MTDPAAYIAAVLELYAGLPDTPIHAGGPDQWMARHFLREEIPLRLVEAALLLGSLRRFVRPSGMPPLPPIRSLAYFRPVIDEDSGLILCPMATSITFASNSSEPPNPSRPNNQKTTFSDAR